MLRPLRTGRYGLLRVLQFGGVADRSDSELLQRIGNDPVPAGAAGDGHERRAQTETDHVPESDGGDPRQATQQGASRATAGPVGKDGILCAAGWDVALRAEGNRRVRSVPNDQLSGTDADVQTVQGIGVLRKLGGGSVSIECLFYILICFTGCSM